MRREKTARFFWAALWLLCTLASLARVCLGAPAQNEQPSNALTQAPPGVPPAVLKEIEDAFRKGSTMKNILEMLQSSGDDVDLHALSQAIASHILFSATNSGQQEAGLSGDGKLPSSIQGDLLLAAMEGDTPELEYYRGVDEEGMENPEATVSPLTTRSERQTTSMTAGSTQGSATQPAISGTSAALRESDATAATIRWLDASRRVDSATSTPMPEEESESEPVTGSPMSPNASLVATGERKEIHQEADTAQEKSHPDAPPDHISENSTSPGLHEASTIEFDLSNSEASEPNESGYTSASAIEAENPTYNREPKPQEDSETFENQDKETVAVTVQPASIAAEDSDTITTQRDPRYKEQVPYGQDEADFVTGVPYKPEVPGTADDSDTTMERDPRYKDQVPYGQDEADFVTGVPYKPEVPGTTEDRDTTTERDPRYKEQVPYGQDEADFVTGVPYKPEVPGTTEDSDTTTERDPRYKDQVSYGQDEADFVTGVPYKPEVPGTTEDSDTTAERDPRYKDQVPYGQDEADFFTGVPFNAEVLSTAATISSVLDTDHTESAEPSFTSDTGNNEDIKNATTNSRTSNAEETEPGIQLSPEESQGRVMKPKKAEDNAASISVIIKNESAQATDFKDQKTEKDIGENQQSSSPAVSTIGSPAAPATPATAASSLVGDDASTATSAVSGSDVSTATSAATHLSTDLDLVVTQADNSTTVPSTNRSSTFSLGDTPSFAPGVDPFEASDSESEFVSETTDTPVFEQPPPTTAQPSVVDATHGTLGAISQFQAPVRSLIIKRLGAEFARLTQVFRRLDLTDPLPAISTIVSEALSGVRVEQLRAPTKRDASAERDTLQLSVNGVRVDVNVTRRPEFVQRGPTIVNHVSIDRHRMYVQLHMHFHNVSVPLNFSVGAELFPPFFSIRRPSGEAHVDVGEVLMPLRIPFKLYFQKTEGETSAAGMLVPEDFVIHGASMLNVTTHLPDCGERNFMEKEVLRFDEHLKSGLELWLSHDPLTSLTDTLRDYLLVASRQQSTMGLSSRGGDVSTLINDGGPATNKDDVTGLRNPPIADRIGDGVEEEPGSFGYGD